MAIYAAYGSNLDPRRMAKRAPSSPVHSPGWLRGWRLTFGGEDIGWDGPVSTVVEDIDSSVFVMLYDLTPTDERNLDSWEGADLGLWRKIRVRVHAMSGDVVAWLYVIDAYEGGLPSAGYLGMIAEAVEAGGAPADYAAAIRRMPCRPDPS